ncbi:retrovirus-related pol polyprotein from transposon TNT 1-94, partial [Tanacetum coccineum]
SLRSGLASLRDLEIPITLRPLTLLISMKDERTSEEYLRDLEIEFRERALLENLKHYSIKDKGLVAETFNCDDEEVSDDKEMIQVKVLMALADDELIVGKNHAHNGHNRVILVRGGVLAESSKFSESLVGMRCNTCGSTVYSTTDHNDFEHFKRGEKIRATKAREPTKRYPLDEFLHEDEPSRQYQANSDISYYIIPYGRSLTELTKDTQVLEVVTPNEQNTPHAKDVESFRPSMLTRSMAAKLVAASASECLFAEFLSEIEPKKVFEALRHPQWVDAMQEELNQFYRNKVWTLVPLPHRKIAIGSKWVFKNKKDELRTVTRNKARLVTQGYSQEEGIDYDETFPCLCHLHELQSLPNECLK